MTSVRDKGMYHNPSAAVVTGKRSLLGEGVSNYTGHKIDDEV